MRIASGIKGQKNPLLGTELAGVIEAVGKDVARSKIGDQVYGFTGMSTGTYVEYRTLPEDGIVTLEPANMTYEEAAAVPYGALTAFYFLRKGNIQSGQEVLVFGASGGVGNYAVQLAKHFGAEVTGVRSTSKLDFVKSLGADKVIDYTQEDFAQSGQIYDIIFDTMGKTSVSRSKNALKKKGFYVFATFGLPLLINMLWLSLTSSKKAVSGLVEGRPQDLVSLRELIEEGKLKSVIDRHYPMEQAAEAHRYVETRRK